MKMGTMGTNITSTPLFVSLQIVGMTVLELSMSLINILTQRHKEFLKVYQLQNRGIYHRDKFSQLAVMFEFCFKTFSSVNISEPPVPALF